MTPEGGIKQACLQWLLVRGIYAWNNSTGAMEIRPGQYMKFGKKGSSDIIGILPGGRFLAVECKSRGGRLSERQKEFLKAVNDCGGLGIVAYGIDDIETAFLEAGILKKPRK